MSIAKPRTKNLPLAVSVGDPSGIGPDIILKAWAQKDALALPALFVAGNRKHLARHADILGLAIRFEDYRPGSSIPSGNVLHVLDIGHEFSGAPGKPQNSDAAGTIKAIDVCVDLTLSGKACGVVTCPINKKVLYKAGFRHPGHTEYLAELAHKYTGKHIKPVMMLAGPELRTIPVTIHIPLAEVPRKLTAELIVETALTAASDLTNRFGIKNPKLAVSGLNPHAGEEGSMGKEEEKIIKPAIAKLQDQGINAVGPLPADTMFHAEARSVYDVAICMYHDQALIPAKALGFDDAVNVTLGLPFIRTSPDHGTAYDIAGSGNANPASFVAALRMAHQMSLAK